MMHGDDADGNVSRNCASLDDDNSDLCTQDCRGNLCIKKPFGNVTSADEFHKAVFEKGARPKVKKCWPQALRGTMTNCWLAVQVKGQR